MKIFFGFLILFLGLPAAADSVGYGAPALSYSDIVKIIETRKQESHPITSVDELLGLLPKGLKFTVIYSTQSRLQDASTDFPRAVAFNDSLYFTFNGSPDQKGYNSIELIEYDFPNRKFEFRDINFSADKPVQYASSTPAKCLGCHGSDPKPIWHGYNQWPGVYGSNDEHLSAIELPQYKSFIAKISANPQSRYRFLGFPFVGKPASYPYFDHYEPDHREYQEFEHRFNLQLTDRFAVQNAYRVARIAEANDNFKNNKDLVTFLSLVREGVSDCSAAVPAKLPQMLSAATSQTFAPVGSPFYSAPDLFEAVMKFSGLPTARFSLQKGFRGDSYLYDGISVDEVQGFATVLVSDNYSSDPGLAGAIPAVTDQLPFGDYLYSLGRRLKTFSSELANSFDGGHSCGILVDRIEKNPIRLTSWDPARAPRLFSDDATDAFAGKIRVAEMERSDPAVPVSCTYCHALGGGHAPVIPFTDEKSLRALFKQGNLRNEILKRIDPAASDQIRMPPSKTDLFPALNADEIKSLSDYVLHL